MNDFNTIVTAVMIGNLSSVAVAGLANTYLERRLIQKRRKNFGDIIARLEKEDGAYNAGVESVKKARAEQKPTKKTASKKNG